MFDYCDGIYSDVPHRIPKLNTRVRFPSSAPSLTSADAARTPGRITPQGHPGSQLRRNSRHRTDWRLSAQVAKTATGLGRAANRRQAPIHAWLCAIYAPMGTTLPPAPSPPTQRTVKSAVYGSHNFPAAGKLLGLNA